MEDLLIIYFKVVDVVVFGVFNVDFGEEVKVVIQLLEGIELGEDLVEEFMVYCVENFF